MSRYIKSFTVTLFIFSSIFILIYILFYNKTTYIAKKSLQRVKIDIVYKKIEKKSLNPKEYKKSIKETQLKKIKKKLKKQKSKEIKEEVTKKVFHKLEQTKKKENKIIKKVKKKSIEKRLYKKPIKTTIKNKLLEKSYKKSRKNNTNKNRSIKKAKSEKIFNNKSTTKRSYSSVSRIDKSLQSRYFIKVRRVINANKVYPQRAIKRGIEGSVEIEFTISKNGYLISYKALNGNILLKNAAIEALKRSFPLPPPPNTINSNATLSVNLNFNINR